MNQINFLTCPVHLNSPLSLVPLPYKGLTHQFGLVCEFDPNAPHYINHDMTPLILCAEKSHKRKPYFKQLNSHGGGGVMTDEHLHAQYLVQQWIREGKTLCVKRYICPQRHFQICYFGFAQGTKCELEYRPHHGVIGDVVAIDESGDIILCVEVKVTHATEKPRHCEWIEVDASEIIQSESRGDTVNITDIRSENPNSECGWYPSQPCRQCEAIAERCSQLQRERTEQRRLEEQKRQDEEQKRRIEELERKRKEEMRRDRIIESLPIINCSKCKRLCELTNSCGHIKLCDDCQDVCDREGLSECLICLHNASETCATCGEKGLVIPMQKCSHHLCLLCCHKSHQAKDKLRPYVRGFDNQMKANQIWHAGNYCIACTKNGITILNI